MTQHVTVRIVDRCIYTAITTLLDETIKSTFADNILCTWRSLGGQEMTRYVAVVFYASTKFILGRVLPWRLLATVIWTTSAVVRI